MPYADPIKRREYNKDYRVKHRERLRVLSLVYSKENKVSIQHYKRRHKYGLSQETYDRLFTSQNGRCRICGEYETAKDVSGNIKSLAVDHNHSTQLVRALLCSKCNLSLGLINERPEIALRAYAYLLEWRERHEKDLINAENLLTS